MAEKDLSYRLTADIAAFEAQFKRAQRATAAVDREFAKLEAQQAKVHAAMEQVGRGMLVAGAAIAAGLGLAVKAAIDWESAWAGVVKTVDGTDEQMAALEQELRDLTDVLPATHREIAAVAEAAGQLGIKRQDITEFTRTMIDMGVATNLSAEEAAFAIARMSNIMGTAPKDVRRLASAIVDLGNNSATTEGEIVEMALRISGAGNIIGLSEADVLGFSAALSSVGINAEAGGSAISLAFTKIDTAVTAGGEKLEKFAEVAGMSADEFRTAYEQDAAGAINTFIQGLGRIDAAGGDVFGVLDSLGLSGIRLRDALLRLSGAGDLLTRSLKTGASAWEENNALTKEAERRYATTESRMLIARNSVNDFAISMGQTLLPAVGAVVDFIGGFASVLGDLPGPLKTTLAILAAVAAALLLAGGAALIAVPRFAAMSTALDTMTAAGGRAAAMAGLVRGATSGLATFMLGPWGLAIGAAVVALMAFGAASAANRAEVEEFQDTLDEVSGAITQNTRVLLAHKIAEEGASDSAKKLGISTKELVDALSDGPDALKELDDKLRDITDRSIAGEKGFEGQAQEAAQLRAKLRELSKQLEEARDKQKDIGDATKDSKEAMDALDPAARGMAENFGLSADAAKDLAESIDDLEKELKALLDEIYGVEIAEDALTEAFRNATEAAKENKAGIEGNSKGAIQNRKNIRDLVSAHTDHLVAMRKNGAGAKELAGAHAAFRKRLIGVLMSMGLSRKEAVAYANKLRDIPNTVKTNVRANTRGAERSIDRIRAKLNDLARTRHIRVAGVTGAGGFTQRWGGVVAARHGLVTPAHVARGQMIKYAEPETGGEAFIPRLGNRQRNLDILNIAAGWNGMGLHPLRSRSSGGGGGVVELGGDPRSMAREFVKEMRNQGLVGIVRDPDQWIGRRADTLARGGR